jgi:eukaryotic-like serine/threonine-protein kinase
MIVRGSRLGTYEVLEPLGAGGMGEVFRARDTRLGRDVALKVLFERYQLDPHRLARFEQETRVLASLNHPNIATLHGIEQLGDTHALVLELIDGETLAERIADGPIPLSQALAIAGQIAAGLEAAHEHGVVHRDLKPANIKLRRDGTLKLLDFGLAKMLDPATAHSDARAATVTGFNVQAGTIMGTPAYMSPEQARGLPVDKRTDIWAFGCVLYEMLTGRPAFAGEQTSDVLARIIEREPDLAALPAGTPQTIRRLIRRCLEKEPRERLRDMGDARLEIAEALGGADGEPETAHRVSTSRRVAFAAVIVAVISASIAGIALFAARSGTDPVTPRPVVRFALPAEVITTPSGRAVAISADGARLAYISSQGLFVHSRDRLDVTQVHGLAGPGAGAPFFSPDGKWLGFSDGQALMKMPVAGGPAVTVAQVGPAAVGSWTAQGIVFADMQGIFRVPDDGGTPQPLLTRLGPYEQAMFPQLLLNRRALIFTIIPTRTNTPGTAAATPGARVEVMDLATGERRTLLRGGGRAQYVPTGHLIYAAGDTLYAVGFDVDRLAVSGDAVAVLTGPGIAEFAVSDEGTLVYRSGTNPQNNKLVWVDRQGRQEALETPPRPYLYPRLSPDGTRIAIDVPDTDRDIWMWDVRRKTLERFTRDPAGNPMLAWSRDGRRLAFGSDRFGVTNLFWQAADGGGEPERLLQSDRIQMPNSFAPDGRLLFSADVAGRGRDLHALATDGTGRVEPIIHGPGNDLTADVSPDGRWIAYDSDEAGQLEVYVRPYPNAYAGGRWQISSGGGKQALWSRDGRELFFRDYSGALMSAAVTLAPTFAPGPVVKVFDNANYLGGGTHASGRTYDLSLDGKRFLMVKQQEATPALVVVLNWFEELKRLVPAR